MAFGVHFTDEKCRPLGLSSAVFKVLVGGIDHFFWQALGK